MNITLTEDVSPFGSAGAVESLAVTPDVDRARRLGWLDAAKGIGIVLVVLGHAVGGLIDSKTAYAPEELKYLFFVVYTFHMPLFFFLSAVLIESRVRKSTGGFVRSLLGRIVYPYFLWSIIQVTIIYLSGSLVNAPLDSYVRYILVVPWSPPSQFWFLYALAILQVIALVGLRLSGRAVCIAALLGLWLLGFAIGLPGPLGQTAHFALYFALGIAVGPRAGGLAAEMLGWRSSLLWLVFAGTLLLCINSNLLPVLAQGPAAGIASSAWAPNLLPAALAGTVLVLGVAARMQGRPARFFAFLGRASMTIYLTHVILIAGSRIIILKLAGPVHVALLLPLLTVIGIAGPIAIQVLARRMKVDRVLALQ